MLAPWKKSYDQPREHVKNQKHYFTNKGPSSQSYGFSSGHVWMWDLDYKAEPEELMLLNCGVGEDSGESLGRQGDPTSPSQRKSVPNIHWKDWYWSWNSNTLATWCEELTPWKRPWCCERLKLRGGRDNRGWGGWMASLTQWTWVWVGPESWWWTGKPGMLQSYEVAKSQIGLSNWSELKDKSSPIQGYSFMTGRGGCLSDAYKSTQRVNKCEETDMFQMKNKIKS